MSKQRTSRSETKYGDQIPEGHWTDDESEATEDETHYRATVETQTVEVTWRTDPRDLRFRVHVSHGDHRWCPVASFAGRAHRLAESNQWDPMGRIDWADLPLPVQKRVATVVAGVDHHQELDPETRLIDPDKDQDRSRDGEEAEK